MSDYDNTENGDKSSKEDADESNQSKDPEVKTKQNKASQTPDIIELSNEPSSEEGKTRKAGGGSEPETETTEDEELELIEVTNVKLLRELQELRDLYPDFVKNREPDQTIDEIRGSKTTGTSKSHIDEVKSDSDGDSDLSLRDTGTNTKFRGINRRSESKDTRPSEKTASAVSPNKPLKFLLEQSAPVIPGQPQNIHARRLVKIGSRNKKSRSMGINTAVSIKPEKMLPRISESKDSSEHTDEDPEDVEKNTGKLKRSRKSRHSKKPPKKTVLVTLVEPDDQPIDIGIEDSGVRNMGVNTKSLSKMIMPPVSEAYKHFNDKHRDIGTLIDARFKPTDDGTVVDFMKPILDKSDKGNDNIVRSQPEIDPYKIHERGNGRAYYPGCEYHFPGKSHWRRLFQKNRLPYQSLRCCDWVFTFFYAVLYVLFILVFSMAWVDIITNDQFKARPISKKTQPIISFAPVGSHPHIRTISFNPRNNSDVSEKFALIMRFLQKYNYENSGKESRFGVCTPSNKFGYSTGQPCVFLKANRVIGFKTEPYTHIDEVSQRGNISNKDYLDLKNLLENNSASEVDRQNRTWITCNTGQHKDIEIVFHPEPAFRTEYTDIGEETIVHEAVTAKRRALFGPEDLNRIVALEIKNLKANEKVQVRCKLWAHNIRQEKEDQGQIVFYVVLLGDPPGKSTENVTRHHDDSL
ncbi:uncharacterized protein LOC110185875 [Drosophila serrata]|uniref:uncharacterized protein LOC110185875 n=1 Tax=Drosophila serrata TaxID=7274 RepID=UPI000A1D2218|nr:uncharacterized protein LOC110185875 [Drosophila serrata]